MKKTKNLEEFTRDLSFKLPRTVTGSPETRREWRFSDDPWLPPSLLCSACLLLLLLLRSGEKQKERKKKQKGQAAGMAMIRWFGSDKKKQKEAEEKC